MQFGGGVTADSAPCYCCDVQSSIPGQRGQGELKLQLVYKAFEDDEASSAGRASGAASEAEAFALLRQDSGITDVKSAAGAYAPGCGDLPRCSLTTWHRALWQALATWL
jgi:hypothetical protein